MSYGLRPDLLSMSNVWRGTGNECTVAAKGAPETIGMLCHGRRPARRAARAVDALAREGLRVLGVARGIGAPNARPKSPRDFAFRFSG